MAKRIIIQCDTVTVYSETELEAEFDGLKVKLPRSECFMSPDNELELPLWLAVQERLDIYEV